MDAGEVSWQDFSWQLAGVGLLRTEIFVYYE